MIARPDIDTLLSGPLGAWLDEQSLVRAKARQLAKDRWWKAAMIGGPLLIFLWVLPPVPSQIRMFATFGVAAAGYAWGNAPRTRAIKAVKVGINEAIAHALGLTYTLEVEPGEPFDLACRFQMLPKHQRSQFEDEWHGMIEGRRFSLHEAHLEQRRDSGKRSNYVTVFRGAVMAIDFTRDFHGTTLVERANLHRSIFGGRKDSVTLNGARLDYVDMVDPAFDEAFCVFSTDQVEARYLVHPAYAERLIAVQTAFAGKDIRALFSHGDLVIVVETENMFESGSIEASDDRSRIERTVDQFVALADLAQSLNERERAA